MKKLLIAFALLTLAIINASAADTKTFQVQTRTRQHVQRHTANLSRSRPIGAFARVDRGNPLQLINPRAPQHYFGPPQETIVYNTENYEANHHPQPVGVILFGLAW